MISYFGAASNHNMDQVLLKLPQGLRPEDKWDFVATKANQPFVMRIDNSDGRIYIWSASSAALSAEGRIVFNVGWLIA